MEKQQLTTQKPITEVYQEIANNQEDTLITLRTPLLDPRQKVAWDSYINPKSKTFGNATQSAIEAGYGKSYAEHIGKKEWWCGKMRKLNLLDKGEEVLEEMLNMTADDAAMKRIKLDTAKFVLEHLGKDMGYSKRSELTGKDGGPIQISPEKKAEADEAIRIYLETNAQNFIPG
jgi:phage terminase small subunit